MNWEIESRLQLLSAAVGNADTILILPHNDPDPDAITSAVALRHLLVEAATAEAIIAYRGIIGRAENRMLVHYLGYPLRPLAELALPPVVRVAMVDAQPNAGNAALPPGASLALVLD